MNNDIHLQEVVGQIRDLSKMFKALKYADDMMTALINAKNYLDDWSKQVEAAKVELAKVNAKTIELLNTQAETEKAIKTNTDKISEMLVDADKQKNAILKSGKNEAEGMVNTAKVMVEKLNSDIDALSTEKTKLLKDVSDAQNALMAAKKQILDTQKAVLHNLRMD